ncbi:hypothetical protein E2C00_19920 [Streptomyces sp. WAC05374]|uniref:D-glucuronyl C5-epimerase family protein n=1 Tax=Streptomyces sp. WAC05374 TaxID=2487420 RepID=UPI000F864E09|nr:D-glucuronyl C5-epimerase family protein [Streptomyces sp. WAC05374]RST09354.1 hypothetical protein EF905_29495 [Streptomyces sp. WAC05374]TDF40202.1 hypothetical protein E2B92_25270 [Streptomyces sp. WAC05374]TDF53392.1 hypothetical protein E2C00_19920 [Streptomyces sp. WAC05374]TDF59239.1 hypothetical protein E2C02_05400 [Streptomyces sp. WAC05374]
MYWKPTTAGSTKPGPVGYDHPVGQIQFGLGCITSYRTETDPTRKALFLKRAKDQANRLITKRVQTRGAWYFPYPWDYKHAEHGGVDYKAPWYSGMARGEAISLFAQLAMLDSVTEQERTPPTGRSARSPSRRVVTSPPTASGPTTRPAPPSR